MCIKYIKYNKCTAKEKQKESVVIVVVFLYIIKYLQCLACLGIEDKMKRSERGGKEGTSSHKSTRRRAWGTGVSKPQKRWFHTQWRPLGSHKTNYKLPWTHTGVAFLENGTWNPLHADMELVSRFRRS